VKSSGTARNAVLLSAFVMPGAGQLLQGRPVAAAFFGGGFLASFTACLAFTGRVLWVYYCLGFAPERVDGTGNMLPAAAAAVISLFVALILYAAGLVDTVAAQRRASRMAQEAAARRLAGL